MSNAAIPPFKKDTSKKRSIFSPFSTVRRNPMEQMERIPGRRERLEHISFVVGQLMERYQEYEAAPEFLKFVGSVEELFVRAQIKGWSVEDTQEELIREHIEELKEKTGTDEKVFDMMLQKFQQLDGDVETVRAVADGLRAKYEATCSPECVNFISYLEQYVLVFSEAIHNDLSISDAKRKIVEVRMKIMARHTGTSLDIFEEIFAKFMELIQGDTH